MPNKFLSEEDLDLQNLSWDELIQVWNDWLDQAQATNDEVADKFYYSNSCFGDHLDLSVLEGTHEGNPRKR